jgi:hypothetical protein
MPLPKKGGVGGQAPSAPTAPTRGGLPKRQVRAAAPEAEYPTPTPTSDDSGINPVAATAGVAAGLGGVALLAKTPGLIGKGARAFDAVRKQLMLSGLALPKSLLGNLGAGVERSIETGSMTPVKQMFSKQTFLDAVKAYGDRDGIGLQHGMDLPGPVPGRIMGAFDTAAQKALMRSGATADEAQAGVLQTPLGGKLGEALEGPVAQYLHPFRRTPFNQFLEGLKKMDVAKTSGGERRALGVYAGAGAAHGAATADDDTPLSLPIGIAASARYGMPYGLAAMAGRALAGGSLPGSGIAGSLLPVSEWGLESAITDPFKPFKKPAALTALEKLTGQ